MDEPSGLHELSLTYEVIEDLHTGTGTGTWAVDSLQARDSRGIPCIPRSHLKGLLRISAIQLERAGKIKAERIAELFGDATGTKGRLIVPTLHGNNEKGPVETILWSETARSEGSRMPADDSLRVIEFIPAGIELHGTFLLRGHCDAELKSDIECIVKRVQVLGSERNRGSGLVKIKEGFKWSNPDPRELPNCSGVQRIRLVLRNLEPLTIPISGYAGNIIRSESHIPGRVLFGALAAWELEQASGSTLFGGQIRVGNAYPLPMRSPAPLDPGHADDWAVIPMPLNIYRHKDNSTVTELNWPYWCPQPGSQRPGDALYYDNLESSLPFEGGKRPKGHSYLYFENSQTDWNPFSMSLTISMRNRRGQPEDLRSKEETDLFSVEQVPADFSFLVDITGKPQALREFIASFESVLRGTDILTIGRGGAPIKVEWPPIFSEDRKPFPFREERRCERDGDWQITLTSDLVARAWNTGFYSALSVSVLADLLKISGPNQANAKSSSDFELQGAFNAASGLPRPPITVIRRGSVLRLPNQGTEEFKSKLIDLDGEGLGERVHEGYGRFVLDFFPDLSAMTPLPAHSEIPAPSNSMSTRLELALKVVDDRYSMVGFDLCSKDVLRLIACLATMSGEPDLKTIRTWLLATKQGLKLKPKLFSEICKAFPRKSEIDYRDACLIALKYLADKLRNDNR